MSAENGQGIDKKLLVGLTVAEVGLLLVDFPVGAVVGIIAVFGKIGFDQWKKSQ